MGPGTGWCAGESSGVGAVTLPFPSVGATENLILAALGAEGTTTIYHAAREPEIGDLLGFLTAAARAFTEQGLPCCKSKAASRMRQCTPSCRTGWRRPLSWLPPLRREETCAWSGRGLGTMYR